MAEGRSNAGIAARSSAISERTVEAVVCAGLPEAESGADRDVNRRVLAVLTLLRTCDAGASTPRAQKGCSGGRGTPTHRPK